MADEEHAEIGEYTASDEESVAGDQPRADLEPPATEDDFPETISSENIETDEETMEQVELTVVSEDVPHETMEESQTSSVGSEETLDQEEQAVVSEDVPPETVEESQTSSEGYDEHGGLSPDEAGTPEGDMQQHPDSTDTDFVVPAVSDEEAVATESVEPGGGVPVEEASTAEGDTQQQPDTTEAGAAVIDEEPVAVESVEPGTGMPVEEAGTAEGDMQQQPDTTETEVGVPAVTNEEPLAAESVAPQDRMPLEGTTIPEGDMLQQPSSTEAEVVIPDITDAEPVEPQELAASPADEHLSEVVDDGYKDTENGRLSDTEEEEMGVDELGEDLPQSAEQLADKASEVMPYPSADNVDVIEEDLAKLIAGETERDELAKIDKGDLPDPTRPTDKVGPVQECPKIPLLPALLLEDQDDIETPKDKLTVPSVLASFFNHFYMIMFH